MQTLDFLAPAHRVVLYAAQDGAGSTQREGTIGTRGTRSALLRQDARRFRYIDSVSGTKMKKLLLTKERSRSLVLQVVRDRQKGVASMQGYRRVRNPGANGSAVGVQGLIL